MDKSSVRSPRSPKELIDTFKKKKKSDPFGPSGFSESSEFSDNPVEDNLLNFSNDTVKKYEDAGKVIPVFHFNNSKDQPGLIRPAIAHEDNIYSFAMLTLSGAYNFPDSVKATAIRYSLVDD